MSSTPPSFESPSKKVGNGIQVDERTASVEKIKLYNAHVDVSGVDERQLIRKVDMRTIPWLTLLYLFCFLDRTSIGNAKLYNMERDLHLTDNQYLACLTIFFVSYSLLEVPANIVLKRLRPSIWFSAIMVGWGIMMTLQGLVQNFGGLMAMRWLLGVMEAGFFPGVSYYLSCWYKHSEYGTRFAVFFSAVTAAGAFGGLFAASSCSPLTR
ncbi:hypothetical protein SCLCIDRAFT_1017134 [Scleroderma citrinum Foug A]|uniref:Major facilitator superfamily (MFS) profile domain-containing protein n=1 Tax=Scleroderma citrinum Foug A TaxID=1036808 RepID=A0A0C3EJ84_9AGAM|nr:hypothetical protein SCLCIDRAFT_1017134 [Scleroderma citrinum Foug A]